MCKKIFIRIENISSFQDVFEYSKFSNTSSKRVEVLCYKRDYLKGQKATRLLLTALSDNIHSTAFLGCFWLLPDKLP